MVPAVSASGQTTPVPRFGVSGPEPWEEYGGQFEVARTRDRKAGIRPDHVRPSRCHCARRVVHDSVACYGSDIRHCTENGVIIARNDGLVAQGNFGLGRHQNFRQTQDFSCRNDAPERRLFDHSVGGKR